MMERVRLRAAGPQALLQFNEALLGIVRARIPLDRGLVLAAKEMSDPRMRQATESVMTRIGQGRSISQALGDEPSVFPRSYVDLIAVGEEMDSLTGVLEHLIAHYRRQVRFRDGIVSAAVYPVFVFIVCVAITLLIFTHVVPGFAEIYDELGAQLPPLTALVLAVGQMLVRLLPVIIVVGCALLVYGLVTLLSRDVTRSWWSVLRFVPFFSLQYQYLNCSTFLSTMGMLVERGVPITTGLALVRAALVSRAARSEVDRARERIERGESVGEALSSMSFLPPVSAVMLSMGGDGHDLGKTMIDIAEHYDLKTRTMQDGFTTLVEPMMIVAVGIFVGTLVVSLYLPLFYLPKVIR